MQQPQSFYAQVLCATSSFTFHVTPLFFPVSLMLSIHCHSALADVAFSFFFLPTLCLFFMCTLAKNAHTPPLRQIGPSGSAKPEEWRPSRSDCQNFYQVPLTRDKVHFVDSPEALQRCRNTVLKVQRTKYLI